MSTENSIAWFFKQERQFLGFFIYMENVDFHRSPWIQRKQNAAKRKKNPCWLHIIQTKIEETAIQITMSLLSIYHQLASDALDQGIMQCYSLCPSWSILK